ncbi:DUF6456 domain-containing protein [Glycocaulis sp.]
MSAPSWLIRLDRPGRRIALMPGGRSFGVYANADRRRRPFAVLSARELDGALHSGLIEPGEGESFVITMAGQAHLRRARAGDGAEAQPFAGQHRQMQPRAVMMPAGRIETVMANALASPLARYAMARNGRPPLLDQLHVVAGDRLRADYDASSMRSRLVGDWSAQPRQGRQGARDPADAPARMLDAKTRVMDALAAVGPGLDRLLVNVCLRETGMERAERDMGWPGKAGAPALRLALDRLAVHYGLKRPEEAADPFG